MKFSAKQPAKGGRANFQNDVLPNAHAQIHIMSMRATSKIDASLAIDSLHVDSYVTVQRINYS